MLEYQGKLIAGQAQFAIVVSRFNEMITKNLLDGALNALKRFGVEDSSITAVWVPGSFEIPLAAKQMAASGKYDAVICLGAVIRGATAHFDYVCSQVASGVSQTCLKTNIPVIFGVLTTDTIEQAIERAGTKAGNKGFEAALSAIEMVDLMKQLTRLDT